MAIPAACQQQAVRSQVVLALVVQHRVISVAAEYFILMQSVSRYKPPDMEAYYCAHFHYLYNQYYLRWW